MSNELWPQETLESIVQRQSSSNLIFLGTGCKTENVHCGPISQWILTYRVSFCSEGSHLVNKVALNFWYVCSFVSYEVKHFRWAICGWILTKRVPFSWKLPYLLNKVALVFSYLASFWSYSAKPNFRTFGNWPFTCEMGPGGPIWLRAHFSLDLDLQGVILLRRVTFSK